MEKFNSPIFGLIRDPSEDEEKVIALLVRECPAAVFGCLNKALNARGAMIDIQIDPDSRIKLGDVLDDPGNTSVT
jgi:hypothetical protein